MNETELIDGLQRSDETAFRELVDNYSNRVFNTALNILHDISEAEDASQEVFISVFESISSFKGESTLSTWIYRIAVRKAIDKLRRRKTRDRLKTILPWIHDKKIAEEKFYHPGVAAENKEKAAILYQAINLLPENQRLAFILIKVQGMRYDEVSEIMQIGVKAIESLVSRAKVNLQKSLQHLKNK